MRATVLDTQQLTSGPLHHAFTSLAQWRGEWYCAYRVAVSHAITPPGHAVIQHGLRGLDATDPRVVWLPETIQLVCTGGDVRDPRLIATDEALYCLCGVYGPDNARHPWLQGLAPLAADNLMQTHIAYTTDGTTWTPLLPIMKPNYWGWSVCRSARLWFVAAYHPGTVSDTAQNLTLFVGSTLLQLSHYATIYDGFSVESEGDRLHYPHLRPCEPVLWQPAPDTLACAVRTERSMDIGVSRYPHQAWRWHDTQNDLHPSAVLTTPRGTLLAAREVITTHDTTLRTNPDPSAPERLVTHTTWRTVLYELPAGRHTPRKLLSLPSWGDNAYAGLAPGPTDDTVLCSWYSQTRRNTLPGAQVSVAMIQLKA